MPQENSRRFFRRNATAWKFKQNCIAEILETRVHLSAGTFPTTPATYLVGQGSVSYPAVGVFTSNGLPDIALANGSLSGQDGSISVLLNKGDGTFGTAS